VKLATVFPDNPGNGFPTIHAAVVYFSSRGVPEAVLDGVALTQLRTGAASALASRYLSRVDSSRLLIIGTGALAPTMAAAHCAVRPITRIDIWGRNRQRVEATIDAVGATVSPAIELRAVVSLGASAASADIICCATSSARPAESSIAPGSRGNCRTWLQAHARTHPRQRDHHL
jgi:ornithine cyclodeaminase/alanine dehydrogenase-like protein (mu-crystallin family)